MRCGVWATRWDLEIQDPELTEVTYSLNALLEDLDH